MICRYWRSSFNNLSINICRCYNTLLSSFVFLPTLYCSDSFARLQSALWHPFFRYPRYSVRKRQLATNIVTKHPWFRKGAVINGSGAARVVTVAASAYNSKRAVRWLNASIRNKAPTMQSSLTSSSRVNRASRGLSRGEISELGRRCRAAPCRATPRHAATELLAYLRGWQIDDPIFAVKEPIHEREPPEAVQKNRIAPVD